MVLGEHLPYTVNQKRPEKTCQVDDYNLEEVVRRLFNKKTEGQMCLRPLAVWRSTVCRSMTLRPHLAMGLPFRGLIKFV